MFRVLIPLVALTACNADKASLVENSISPAEGQTSVSGVQPLRISGTFDLPEGYPADAIVVIDAESGGLVEGVTELNDGEIRFVPAEPWLNDRDYLWTVRDPLPETRQPVVRLPDGLRGTALFSTTNELTVLAVAPETDAVCVVLSRPLDVTEIARLRLTLDDEPADVLASDTVDISENFEPGDPGLGAACLAVGGAQAAEQVRIWVDDLSALFVLDDSTLDEAIADLQRRDP